MAIPRPISCKECCGTILKQFTRLPHIITTYEWDESLQWYKETDEQEQSSESVFWFCAKCGTTLGRDDEQALNEMFGIE